MTDQTQTAPVVLTAEERDLIWFIPQADGGKEVPEHVQAALAAKGLAALNPADGRRWLTLLGDKVRRGVVPVVVEG